MIANRKQLLHLLNLHPPTPALRRVVKLATSPKAVIDSFAGRYSTAGELASVWRTRLSIATSDRRRFPGLPALARELEALPPGADVQVIALRDGLTTALFFSEPAQQRILGAVISVRREADVRRSLEQFQNLTGTAANQTAVSQEHHGTRVAPALAALRR